MQIKYHDIRRDGALALVTTDFDGAQRNWRYLALTPGAAVKLENTSDALVRQGHCVANSIVRGLYVVGTRIELNPSDWLRQCGRGPFQSPRTFGG
jgi:hypothetical protein